MPVLKFFLICLGLAFGLLGSIVATPEALRIGVEQSCL